MRLAHLAGNSTNQEREKLKERIKNALLKIVENENELTNDRIEAAKTIISCEQVPTISYVPTSVKEALHAQAEVAYEAACAAEEISDEEAEELRGLLHECADMAATK